MQTIFTTADNVTADGTPDADTIVVHSSRETISGFGGNDVIFAVGDANTLYGDSTVAIGPGSGTGSDILVGGAGADTLQGGADAFSFGFVPQATLPVLDSTIQNPDLITDLSQAEHDTIDLSAYHGLFPSLPTVFLGTGAFTGEEALQVRYEVRDGYTAVQFQAPTSDNPATPTPLSGEIHLTGAVDLTAANVTLAHGAAAGSGLGGAPPAEHVDWDALAAKATANFEATGHWFI